VEKKGEGGRKEEEKAPLRLKKSDAPQTFFQRKKGSRGEEGGQGLLLASRKEKKGAITFLFLGEFGLRKAAGQKKVKRHFVRGGEEENRSIYCKYM